MRRGRRMTTSVLLSLAMILTTLTGMPTSTVHAEEENGEALETTDMCTVIPEVFEENTSKAVTNASTIFIAGKENYGMYESSYGYFDQDWIYTDGYTELVSGRNIWQDSGQGYNNGAYAKFTYGSEWSTLELQGYRTWGTAGYVKMNQYTEDKTLYGIYYDGNLKILVEDYNEIQAYRSDTLAKAYGIYVTGDLIIMGAAADSSLIVNMHRNKDMTTQGAAYGIFCGGTLSIDDGNKDLDVEARAGLVTGALSASITPDSIGIKCITYRQNSGTVYALGHDCSSSSGVKAKDFLVTGGNLTGKAWAPADKWARGIFATGNMEVRGGTVQGEAGDDSTLCRETIGIRIDGANSLFYGGKVIGKANKAETSIGIQTPGFTLPEGSTASVTGTGAEYATKYNCGIKCSGAEDARTSVTISGGMVNAYGGDGKNSSSAYDSGYGMNLYNCDLIVNKTGQIDARSGSCYRSYALYADTLTCEDFANITAKGGNSGYISDGIYVRNAFAITGGTIYASAMDEYVQYSNGSHVGMDLSYANELSFLGGFISANGGYGYGLNLSRTSINVKGGTVIAKGQLAAINYPASTPVYAASFSGSMNYDGSDAKLTKIYIPQWKYAELYSRNAITMTFDANGGSGSMEPVLVLEGIGEFSFPECSFTGPNGAAFLGWQLSRNGELDGSLYQPGQQIKGLKQDMTVLAVWEEISEPLEITKQPRDWYGKIGKKATFTIEATGSGLHYSWQYKKDDKWYNYNITTSDTPEFKVTMNEKNMKWPLRCVITDASGARLKSKVVYLKDASTSQPITITSQPADFYGRIGKKASFSVKATGNGLKYQWQYKKGTGAWTDYAIATADTANFSVSMNEKNVKWSYRCFITDEDGYTITTNEVKMLLESEVPFAITTQPVDYVGVIGKKASFSVVATGAGLSYQWQYKKGTADWTDYAIATADTANFSVSMNEKNVKWLYRCKITNGSGEVLYTNEVRMKEKEVFAITGQPGDYTGKIGKKATFTVTATGEGLTYEWQVKKATTWSAYTLAGYDTPTFQVSISDKTAKWTYRCVVRDAGGNELATNEVKIYIAE